MVTSNFLDPEKEEMVRLLYSEMVEVVNNSCIKKLHPFGLYFHAYEEKYRILQLLLNLPLLG